MTIRNAKTEAPPIGLIPKAIHRDKRIFDIYNAIERYYLERLPIPIIWIEEYNELVKEK